MTIDLVIAIALAFAPVSLRNDDAMLYMIMQAESSGNPEVKLHPDKKSYGLFGLTEIACKEVDEEWPPATPNDELRAARKYLHRMAKLHDDDLFEAAGWYHGGSEERRKAYIDKLGQTRTSDESVELFKQLLKNEK